MDEKKIVKQQLSRSKLVRCLKPLLYFYWNNVQDVENVISPTLNLSLDIITLSIQNNHMHCHDIAFTFYKGIKK